MLVNLSKRPIDPKQAGILNAALNLFLHWDFSKVSIKQIIIASGISKGAFYRFYANKNELLVDLLMDEAFHMDQWVLLNQDKKASVALVKSYFLEVGRDLDRYQLHKTIGKHLKKSEPEVFEKYNTWLSKHRMWVKLHLLQKDKNVDLLYAQLWAMLEGSAALQSHPHFQSLCGRRHPFELFMDTIEYEA